MNRIKILRTALFSLLVPMSFAAGAQVSIEFEQNVSLVADGSTEASMQVSFTNDTNVGTGGISGLQLEMTVPSGISVAGCTNDSGVQSLTGHQLTNCDLVAGPGTFTLGYLDQDAITGGSSNQAIPDGTIFTVEFTAAPGTSGDALSIGFTDLTNQAINTMFDTNGDEVTIQPGTNFNGTEGSINIECPAGESCYASSPIAVGGEFAFGETVVGKSTSNIAITIENDTTSDNSFDLTGANSAAFVNVVTEPSVTLNPGDNEQYVFSCIPQSRDEIPSGDPAAENAIGVLNNSSTDGPEAFYDATCTGLAPNVGVIPPADTEVLVTIPTSGTNTSSATYEIFNDDSDELSSEASGVEVKNLQQVGGTGTAPSISFLDVPTSVPETLTPQSSFDVVCEATTSTSADLFAFTFDVAWQQPQPDGTTTEQIISAQFQCNVTDTAPVFDSAPESPGETITLSAPDGTTDSSLLDVFNENPQGDAFNITGASIINAGPFAGSFSVDELNSGPFTGDGSGTADGTDDLRVNCTPPGVGLISADLEVVTDNAGTKTYPLNCTGTGDPLTSTPAFGGTLSLGSVPPGTQAGPGTIEFSNNLLEGGIELDCTKENDPEGIFTFMQIPVDLEIAPQTTATVDVTAVPPEIGGPFDAVLDCQAMVLEEMITDQPFARATQQNQITVTVSGRPLVIPTMSRWGLVVMSLMLLLVGGLATRRMMA